MKCLRRHIRITLFILSCILLFQGQTVYAATPKLNKTTLTLTVGKTYKLKVKNTKKKVKFSSSKKSVASVSKKGKIIAKKPGTAKIRVKVGKKTYTCKVTVKKKIKYSSYTGTYWKDLDRSVIGIEYAVTINSVKGNRIKFQVYYYGKNGSPLVMTKPIVASLKNGKAKFSWKDNWGCKGKGVITLKNKKVYIKMTETYTGYSRASLDLGKTCKLGRTSKDKELIEW